MNIPVRSQSLHGIHTQSSDSGSGDTPGYSNFDQVIENEFGIVNGIGGLFEHSRDPLSVEAQGSDQLNISSPQSVQPNFRKNLLAKPKKKIRKTR
jgi:hypothetical protein